MGAKGRNINFHGRFSMIFLLSLRVVFELGPECSFSDFLASWLYKVHSCVYTIYMCIIYAYNIYIYIMYIYIFSYISLCIWIPWSSLSSPDPSHLQLWLSTNDWRPPQRCFSSHPVVEVICCDYVISWSRYVNARNQLLYTCRVADFFRNTKSPYSHRHRHNTKGHHNEEDDIRWMLQRQRLEGSYN